MQVFSTCSHQPELVDALAGLQEVGGEVIGVSADMATHEGVEPAFDAAYRELGRFDMLECCAALGAQPIHETAEDGWSYVVDTHLVGYLSCARAAMERMRGRGAGHLHFVSSISTHIKAEGDTVYSATKAGIEAFAATLRKEVAKHDIKITVIQPVSVDTNMQQCSEEEKRQAVEREEMLHADEIAEGILFALTRSHRTDVLNMRIEPRIQKTS